LEDKRTVEQKETDYDRTKGMVDSGKTRAERLASLRGEAEEILAMTVASIKTLRNKRQPQ